MRQNVFRTKLGRSLSVAAACITLIAGVASAAEFSADQVTTMGNNMTIKGKFYQKGNKTRVETTFMGRTSIVITLPEKKTALMLNPTDKTYMEMKGPAGKNMPMDPMKAMKAAGAKKIGSEKVAGYVCDKYKITGSRPGPNGQTMQTTSVVWVSPKLGTMLKSTSQTPMGAINTEMKNIKQQTVPAKMFQVPAGYKKVDMSRGMPGMGPGGAQRMPGAAPHK